MITITNGTEYFTIRKDQLQYRDDEFKGLETKLKHDYWMVELLFVPKLLNENKFKRIIKCRPGGDYCIETYNNLNSKKENEVLLSDSDYREVKLIWDNMNVKQDYRKEALIESFAIRFSYECYQSFILELDTDATVDDVFYHFAEIPPYYNKYKKDIYKRAREILRDKYKVDDLI